MKIHQSRSKSPSENNQIPQPELALQPETNLPGSGQKAPEMVVPFLGALDPGIMRQTLLNNGPKKINFCDTNISKRVLKTRNFQEFRQESEEESSIKTPLSQEINENNIFDQITLKTDRVKLKEQQLRFSKDLPVGGLGAKGRKEKGKGANCAVFWK